MRTSVLLFLGFPGWFPDSQIVMLGIARVTKAHLQIARQKRFIMLFQRQKAVSIARICNDLFFDGAEDVTYWLKGKAWFDLEDGEIKNVVGKSENAENPADRRVEEPVESEWLKEKAQGEPGSGLLMYM